MAFLIPEAMKTVAWERAKGALRELVALQGAHEAGDPEQGKKLQRLENEVLLFIEEVESEELHL